ncbi:MAG: DUF452 family protein [Muribaculaceae bacterium]|nr:DUF452 family protein [Muribaculaceae bacterium]
MKIERILHKENNNRLILILAGWGSDARLYEGIAHIAPEGWDVICISGYDSKTLTEETLQGYDTIYLYAWSLGVTAAEILLQKTKLTRAIAVNGTPLPYNDEFGIPCDIYTGTRNTLSERNLTKFRRRMAGNSETFKKLQTLLPEQPDIEKLKEELDFIQHISEETTACINWDNVYISSEDAIIPTANQINYWTRHHPSEGIIKVEGAHYLPLSEIVKKTIHNPEKVGRRFERAMKTYTIAALPQRLIAERLADMIPDEDNRANISVLEIGHGNGLLSKLWGKKLKAGRAEFIDLYKVAPFEIAREEVYHICDAERWIEASENSYDYILSASAMQWFANPLKFISDVYKRLKPGGMLLLSSFLPGNLCELDSLRPCPIPYKRIEAIRDIVVGLGGYSSVIEDEIYMEFNNVREALMHLKETGVGMPDSKTGEHPIALSDYGRAMQAENGKFRLTYRPVFIRVKK